MPFSSFGDTMTHGRAFRISLPDVGSRRTRCTSPGAATEPTTSTRPYRTAYWWTPRAAHPHRARGSLVRPLPNPPVAGGRRDDQAAGSACSSTSSVTGARERPTESLRHECNPNDTGSSRPCDYISESQTRTPWTCKAGGPAGQRTRMKPRAAASWIAYVLGCGASNRRRAGPSVPPAEARDSRAPAARDRRTHPPRFACLVHSGARWCIVESHVDRRKARPSERKPPRTRRPPGEILCEDQRHERQPHHC